MSVMRRQEFGSPWRLGLSFPRELTLADIAATHWLLVKVLSPSDSHKPLYGTGTRSARDAPLSLATRANGRKIRAFIETITADVSRNRMHRGCNIGAIFSSKR
jgi:hypothetical protein